jgi:hypothetical protein
MEQVRPMPAPSEPPLPLRWISASLGNVAGVRRLAAVAVLISMAFAMAMGEIINRDGVIYVRAAQAFVDRGLAAAMAVYNWPTYSILFGMLSQWTGLPLEVAARLVNTGLMLLLVDSFIRLSHELDEASPRPWMAALVILSFPPLDHRLEIYRDWGYLAFALCAFVFLTRFWQAREGRARDAMAWQLAMFAAFLFRVEAAALIALAPLGLLLQRRPWALRGQRFLLANGLVILLLLAGIALVAAGRMPVGKIQDLFLYLDLNKVSGAFNEAARQIALHALNKYSDDFAGHILAGGIVAMVAWMTLDNLGGLLILLTCFGLYRHRLPATEGYRLVYWLIAIALATLLVFIATRLITVSRYALLASLLVLAVTAHYAARFPAHRRDEALPTKGLRWLTVAGLIAGTAINLTALPDYKGYVREAGLWLRDAVPASTRILSNDSIIEYYAGREPGAKLDTAEKLAHEMVITPPPYYVALKLKGGSKEEALAHLLARPQVREFHSDRADERVAVFYVSEPE